MKRYQNPEIFEYLAISYALGTLKGRARTRFEALMSRHFYLRAVTTAYRNRFSGLVDLLPAEEPPPHIWQNLQKELRLQQSQDTKPTEEKNSFWGSWLQWTSVGFASVIASLLTVWVINSAQPNMYFAQLYSEQSKPMAMVSASKQDMKMAIALPDVQIKDGMVPTLWCLSNQKGMKPMKVGQLKPNGSIEFEIDEETWEGLVKMNHLAISLEPEKLASLGEMKGEIIYEGHLKRVH